MGVYKLTKRKGLNMKLKIKKCRLNGRSKGTNWHNHYKVELNNGETLNVETNEGRQHGKFHLGEGESKSTVYFMDIKGLVWAYDNHPDLFEANPKPSSKVPQITKYNQSEGILTIDSKYEYMDVSPFIKRRVEKILNGDSPNRAWKLLKQFAVIKIKE